jgi:hypothetical protein
MPSHHDGIAAGQNRPTFPKIGTVDYVSRIIARDRETQWTRWDGLKGNAIAYPYFGKNVLKGIHVDQLGAYHYLEYWGVVVVVARHRKLSATRSPCWYAWRPTTAWYHRRHRNLKARHHAPPRSLHDVEFTIQSTEIIMLPCNSTQSAFVNS